MMVRIYAIDQRCLPEFREPAATKLTDRKSMRSVRHIHSGSGVYVYDNTTFYLTLQDIRP
ncbi:hypothetical protein SAMN06265380_101632 [Ruegeria faecimaris]|uniref:Uncharacterized protein n=1 Tax=Ruegeria faecimaris TaxID=686389 RepID=A0A521B6J6_9RHOB|nr:hypothetical protein SAMN06265380_101632 [Ruegeria faecimaris]